MTDPLALPADAVLLHIGPFKTGTTSIQAALAAARPLMGEHGAVYPGTSKAHHDAARSLRQVATGWKDDATRAPDPAVWTQLVREVQGAPGRVVISSEFFGDVDDEQRARLVRELGPERIHVVAAARNVGAIAVSMWQQVLKEGYPISIDEWLKRNLLPRDESSAPNGFWSRVDPGLVARTWGDAVGTDRVTVIALDERDRDLLPTTFERLLGLPAGMLVERSPAGANRGLTAAEAGLLHDLNAAVKGKLSWREYNRFVRDGLVHRLVQVRKPGADEPRPGLPAWATEQVVTAGAQGAAALQESGVRVVGSLESLSASTVAVDTPVPKDVPLDLATEAVVGALAAGARGRWSLEDARGPARGSRQVNETPTRELATVLTQRVRGSIRRRLRRRG